MSFGGHVQDMINRSNQNRRSLPSNKVKFKSDNREMIYRDNQSDQLDFTVVPVKKLDKLKRYRKMREDQERNNSFIAVVVLVICIVMAIVMMYY